MAEHNELGKQGEALALEYLLNNGFKILETNYRYQKAEIDIIARKDNTLIIAEVKLRSKLIYGKPQEAVNSVKQAHLVKAANAYLEENDLDLEVRFDIISISLKPKFKLEHIKEAFYP
jgi:putative endonuclease